MVEIPDRALSVGEAEKLWANDRVRLAAETRCGKRLIAWIDALRKDWR